MERRYRASSGLFFYIAFLAVDALVLGWDGANRLMDGPSLAGVVLAALAAMCALLALILFVRWGRLRVVVSPQALTVVGDGRARHVGWGDIERVREIRGPAYQLSVQGLLPGPYLPHGLLRGETVLELDTTSGKRILLRRALIGRYASLQQEVLRSIPKDTQVDLHARWWRD
ncbi:MAG TPA: PH domain-containing protein [Chloroflexota bacterium]|jgi:hypothetical protein|nr:PH domain-containing protein [Chloroflexota bacterium]